MKILFDMSSICPAPNGVIMHGGAEYTKTVFDYCVRNLQYAKHTVWLYVPYADEHVKEFIEGYKKYPLKIYERTSLQALQNFVNEEEFDVIFSGLVVGDFLSLKLPKNTTYIFTEHGLRGIETKFDMHFVKTERRKIKNFVKLFLSTFCKRFYEQVKIKKYSRQFLFHDNIEVFTVSNHSKYAIEYYYPFLRGKIHVGYSPMKMTYGDVDDGCLKRYGLKKGRYILMISANRGEKNCLRGVEACNLLLKKNLLPEGFKVVIAGVNYPKPFRKLTKKYSEYYCLLKYVKPEELETLYQNAHLFLYPTVNEGFGYPPLEAMKYGTLVAASAVCSIPEVCGDSVLYFNPYDVPEIANRIIQSFDEQIALQKKRSISDRLAYISERQDAGLSLLFDCLLKHER